MCLSYGCYECRIAELQRYSKLHPCNIKDALQDSSNPAHLMSSSAFRGNILGPPRPTASTSITSQKAHDDEVLVCFRLWLGFSLLLDENLAPTACAADNACLNPFLVWEQRHDACFQICCQTSMHEPSMNESVSALSLGMMCQELRAVWG